MIPFKKSISIILIFLFVLNSSVVPIYAEGEDIVPIHSLDELPRVVDTTSEDDDATNRAKLLNALDNAQKNEPSEILFTKAIDPMTVVLLSEKVSYERDSFVLSPTMRPTMRPNVV